jgi:hypothetical protein
MSARTLLPKPRKALRTLCLREQATRPDPVFFAPLDVDEEAGVIRRIKILGWESKNGRRYLPEAVKKRLRLYDGAKCFSNHPRKATDTRDCDDALGVWRNPVLESDGAYADLHYFKAHPLAARVVEDAKRGLGVFGASHNADGQGREDAQGVFVVHDITEVRSVDLVTDAATVTNLRENKIMKTTLRQLLEASKAKPLFKHLLEMPKDEMPALDMPMDAPPEAPAEDDWKADLVAAIGKLVQSEAAENHDLAKKIMAMLKPASAETSSETTTEEDESEEKDDEEKKEDKPMEGRTPRRAPDAVTLTEAKSLCKLAGLAEDAGLLGMLEGSTREKALSLLEWAKGKAAPKAGGVRSQGPVGFRPAGNGTTGAKSTDELVATLKR